MTVYRHYRTKTNTHLCHFFARIVTFLTFKDGMHKKPELLSGHVLHNNCCCWNKSKLALSSTMHQASPVLRAGIAKKVLNYKQAPPEMFKSDLQNV